MTHFYWACMETRRLYLQGHSKPLLAVEYNGTCICNCVAPFPRKKKISLQSSNSFTPPSPILPTLRPPSFSAASSTKNTPLYLLMDQTQRSPSTNYITRSSANMTSTTRPHHTIYKSTKRLLFSLVNSLQYSTAPMKSSFY